MKTPIFLAVWFLFAGALQAQSNNSLSGMVSDPSGLPIARATVILESASGGAERSLLADDTGAFAIPGVAVGSHKLMVSRPELPWQKPSSG
jgi:hypothetical protein